MASAIRRKSVRKGLFGGNRFWMIVGVATYVFRFAKRLAAKDETVISTESLKPGETLIIETSARQSRRERRAARRSATHAEHTAS